MLWQLVFSLATLFASSPDRQQQSQDKWQQPQDYRRNQDLDFDRDSSSEASQNRWQEPSWDMDSEQDWQQDTPQTPRDIARARQALHFDNPEEAIGDMILPDDISEAGIKDTKYRWPGYPGKATVPYVIDSNLAGQKDLILRAMDQYNKLTCIKFVPKTSEKDYIKLTNGQGCNSRLGRVGGEQIINLGQGCHYVGTVVHELGHALGFWHEHQRSDRDTYITVYRNNVTAGYESNFDKVAANQEVISTRFNTNSIMIYGNYAFSKSPGKLMTMVAKNGQPLTEPYNKPGLDNTDINMVKQLYQCR